MVLILIDSYLSHILNHSLCSEKNFTRMVRDRDDFFGRFISIISFSFHIIFINVDVYIIIVVATSVT
jgi:hypothetical protein